MSIGTLSAPERLGRNLTLALLTAAVFSIVTGMASCRSEIGRYASRPPEEFSGQAPVIRIRLTASQAPSVRIHTTGPYRLRSGQALLSQSAKPLADVTARFENGTWYIGDQIFRAGELVLECLNSTDAVGLEGHDYHGDLHLLPSGKATLMAVNHVDLERYLQGVLARELLRNWRLETYQALAVAARTFAVHHLITIGNSGDYDLASGQSAQVYGGIDDETDLSRLAVDSTRGEILAAGPPGKQRLFMTQYSSCCGGRVNPADVLRKAADIEPFRGGQVCEDCRRSGFYRWDPVSVPRAAVLDALARKYRSARTLDRIQRIEVTEATGWGRPIFLRIVGANGKTFLLRAESLRHALLARKGQIPQASKIRSMNCRVEVRGEMVVFSDGRGFGHGVGLCQYGAQGKAMRGWSADRILDFYYPGSKRFRLY